MAQIKSQAANRVFLHSGRYNYVEMACNNMDCPNLYGKLIGVKYKALMDHLQCPCCKHNYSPWTPVFK